ncbi:MAG: hypothetical protein RLZZ324_1083 [Candidatus Parcubacteria bacterium]|jgi:hypothetical protein
MPSITAPTLIRLTVLTMAGFALATVFPAYDDASAATINISVAVVFAAVIGVMLAQVLARRARLLDAVRVELNKLRRLYHLSKNLAEGSQEKFRSWFTELHGDLYAYLMFFSAKDFSAYDDSNPAFRKLSYHVYTLPELDTRKEQALFDDILRTTAQIAEARQKIKELWDNRLSGYSWTALLLMTAGFMVSTLFAMNGSSPARTVAGAALVAALLAIDLIWEADSLAAERSVMSRRYVLNLSKLELRRDHE